MSSIQQQLREAEALYIRKAGDMPENLIFPDIPRKELSGDIVEMVRKAITNSPTLNVFEADIDVAKAEYEGSGSTLYPQVDFEMNGTVGNDVSGLEGDETRGSALLVMNWNLFRGGADKARQQEFIYRHALAKERRADAARQVEQDVRDTWAGVLSSSQRAEQFMKQATANEKVIEVYLDQFSLDRRTLLDVLDAQNELFVSRSNHVNALYTEIFGVFRMLALQGRLLENLSVKTPSEASVALKN
jgi:adhesin transport system outer membrane protein